jgi:hypothetical protein
MKPSRRRRFVFSLVTLAVTAAALSWSLSPGAVRGGAQMRPAGPIFEGAELRRPFLAIHEVRAIGYCTDCHAG